MEDSNGRCGCHCPRTNGGQRLTAQRGPAGIEIPGPRALATMARLPPQKPRRNQDALCETAGSAPHGGSVSASNRRRHDASPSTARSRRSRSGGRPERLHRAWHPRHEGRRIGLSGKKGSPTVNRFVQQCRGDGRLANASSRMKSSTSALVCSFSQNRSSAANLDYMEAQGGSMRKITLGLRVSQTAAATMGFWTPHMQGKARSKLRFRRLHKDGFRRCDREKSKATRNASEPICTLTVMCVSGLCQVFINPRVQV